MGTTCYWWLVPWTSTWILLVKFCQNHFWNKMPRCNPNQNQTTQDMQPPNPVPPMRVTDEEEGTEQGDAVPPLRVPNEETHQNMIPVLTQETPTQKASNKQVQQPTEQPTITFQNTTGPAAWQWFQSWYPTSSTILRIIQMQWKKPCQLLSRNTDGTTQIHQNTS